MENPDYRELTDVFGEALSISNVLAETDPKAYEAFKDLIIDMRSVLGLHLGKYQNISESEKNPNIPALHGSEHQFSEGVFAHSGLYDELNQYYSNLIIQNPNDPYNKDVQSFMTRVEKITELIANNETRNDFSTLVKGITELGFKIDKKIMYVVAYINNENVADLDWEKDGDHSIKAMSRKQILDEVRKQLENTGFSRKTQEMRVLQDTQRLSLLDSLESAATTFIKELSKAGRITLDSANIELAIESMKEFGLERDLPKLRENLITGRVISETIEIAELEEIVQSFPSVAA